MIKIFDSTCHPTISGKFNGLESSFKQLDIEMKKNKIYKACAMGLDNFENYNHLKFINQIKKYKNLVPIAGFNPIQSKKKIIEELKYIEELGFKGIKIHNRISNFSLENKNFRFFLEILEKFDLVCLICCYWHSQLDKYPRQDFLYSLVKAFKGIKNIKTILVHGGNVRLMEFAEFVRSNKNNFLLDLSMTILKYEGSSIDNDIRFLFKNFDERICIGSDHPEYKLQTLRRRFNFFSRNLNLKKKQNIAYKNLENFFN